MSCLHEERSSRAQTKITLCLCENLLIILYLRHLTGLKRIQKLPCFFTIKLWIICFNAKEESIFARQRKTLHVEYRMVRLRQAIQCKHSKNRRQSGCQDCAFKDNRDKCLPAPDWFSSHVHRITDHRGVIQQGNAAHQSENP